MTGQRGGQKANKNKGKAKSGENPKLNSAPQPPVKMITMAEMAEEIHRIGEKMRKDIALATEARRKQAKSQSSTNGRGATATSNSPKKPDKDSSTVVDEARRKQNETQSGISGRGATAISCSPQKPDKVSSTAVAAPRTLSWMMRGGGSGESKVDQKEDSDPECDNLKLKKKATSVSPQNKNLGQGSVMILSVDATPTRVGGLLRLPGKERIIYFYSIDWTSLVTFGSEASVQMEMINAGLALKLFEPFVKPFLDRYGKLVVKTDSHFYQSFKGFKTSDDLLFLEKLLRKVKSLQGYFEHAMKQTNDPDIINADFLSRTDKFPLEGPILKASYSDENNYVLVNLSEIALNTLRDLMLDVPQKYHANANI